MGLSPPSAGVARCTETDRVSGPVHRPSADRLALPVALTQRPGVVRTNPPLSHADVDRRLHRLVGACVLKIDARPELLRNAARQIAKWSNPRLQAEWTELLQLPWPALRRLLLEESADGDRRRQSAPFGGLLTNEERFRILRS